MSNAISTGCPVAHGARSAAPSITDVVGDVSRPHKSLPACKDLQHLPGESGVLDGFRNLVGFVKKGNAHWVECRQEFGPVWRTKFGRDDVVCVAEPKLVNRILVNDERAWSAALAWHAILEGIDSQTATLDMPLTLDFERHREARKLLQPTFAPEAITSYLEGAVPLFDAAVERWIAAGEVDFRREIRTLLAHVSSCIFVGINDRARAEELDQALAEYWNAPLALVKNRWVDPKWRKAMRGYAKMRDMLRPLVRERRGSQAPDLFSRLCREAEGVDWVSDDGIVRMFIGILVGAFDTTSAGLTSEAYLLARNAEWQEQLRSEAFGVGTQPIDYQRALKLERSDWAWRETLRLFPVSSHLPRRALRDVDLDGFRIPAGTYVLTLIGAALHDSSWPTEPLRFDPERFSDERAEDKKQRGMYLPFGSGPHICPAVQLTSFEARALWHSLLTRCRVRLKRDYVATHTYNPIGSVTGDVRLILERL